MRTMFGNAKLLMISVKHYTIYHFINLSEDHANVQDYLHENESRGVSTRQK